MINHLMKKNGEKAFYNDLKRIDFSKLSNNIKEVKDTNYINNNDNKEQTLDIYYKETSELKPIFIDIRGGGFISNDKETNHLFGNYIAQRGFLVFNLNYRLAYPTNTVFDQIVDIDNAINWIVNNAAKYNGNVNEMYIAGHSSAGVLAVAEALICKSEMMRKVYNLEQRSFDFKGVLIDCGLMNFYKQSIAYWGMRKMIFPKKYSNDERYQRLVFENNDELYKLPKTVLITNEKDELKDMTYYFKKLLDKEKVENKLIDSGEDGHMGIIFKPYTEENQIIIDKITDYLKN